MSLQACADLVARGDPRRFRAAMAGPLAARAVLLPLYAFNIEVSRAPWLTAEPLIAEMRLQWWRDALEELAEGRGRRHEVVDALGFLDAGGARALDLLVAARRRDIAQAPFADADELIAYLDATAGSLMEVGLRALGGVPDRATRALGRAAGLARYLVAVPELVARGRAPLPDGRPEALAALARGVLAECPRRLGQAMPGRAALLEGAGARAILGRVARDPGAVALGRLEPGPLGGHLALVGAALFGRL